MMIRLWYPAAYVRGGNIFNVTTELTELLVVLVAIGTRKTLSVVGAALHSECSITAITYLQGRRFRQ